ncbi:phosphatidylinositol-binding clathrin assembly protein-like isoform X2 [Canis lupus baileyi]|uniref:phosphatidylinositol-binding clathrin assembly protein-like isoform X2 n=1 Tax=Canis lupus familiaris TaxID=9615 RepID=UPI000DC6891B|nr:phosphatidylinositol-binding clathrin assembly protein-like isoform X2 [Canis lupus familiaris]XP_025316298.1 phosphatidylinositol-binding clathrin assembly protein-like isoform X2 [Canis lupus dingo]XP_038307249.1 phosphatidylinositol-binding clathrin assembly protein-like isoform X2 [Canis lupus familiaris]XP_038444681.1 phosphatidylinositol-binding clathrin assembly protein-like isoform X2 [Canis lupus familiaris]
MGSSACKAALGATSDEPTEPEPKHLANLIQYINGTNMSVERLADVLSEKTGSRSWVVVFKALVTVHHLMVHGNERFIQHLASRNSLFTLHNFLDKSVIEGYTMSTFIRRYSRYLNEKSLACRLIALDITKTKRGMDGMMRTLDTKQLLNTLLVIQIQFDALLNFNANPDEVTNGVMHAAFTLLFKDSLRLFAAYNEGILNLLDKFFGMTKNQCKESLDIYIKFLERTTKMAHFLKVAEQVGIDQNDIPYLTQAPYSLLEALKQHLASLEEKEDSLPPYSLQHAWIPSIPNNPVVKTSASGSWFTAYKPTGARKQHEKTVANNLDRSLVSLIEDFNHGEPSVKKSDMKWRWPSEVEIAGGIKWQLNTYTSTSTIWKYISLPSVSSMTPTGASFLIGSQPRIHSQPVLRISNPAPSKRYNSQSM